MLTEIVRGWGRQMLSWYFEKRFLHECCSELSSRMRREHVRQLRADSAQMHRDLLSSLPREKTFGARQVMRFVALGVAFFHVSEGAGIEREEAIHLVARANQRTLRPVLFLASVFAYFLGWQAITRSRRLWSFLNRNFPFAPPAWKRTDISNHAEHFGFDYTSCPIATFNRQQESLDLCSAAFCQVDYWIGDALKVRLDRTETLALGDDRCRFRWHPVGTPSDSPRDADAR